MLLGGGARGIMGDPVHKGMKVVTGNKLWIPEPVPVPYVFCNAVLSLPNR